LTSYRCESFFRAPSNMSAMKLLKELMVDQVSMFWDTWCWEINLQMLRRNRPPKIKDQASKQGQHTTTLLRCMTYRLIRIIGYT
jgi:hypothetical protein